MGDLNTYHGPIAPSVEAVGDPEDWASIRKSYKPLYSTEQIDLVRIIHKEMDGLISALNRAEAAGVRMEVEINKLEQSTLIPTERITRWTSDIRAFAEIKI